MKTAKEIQNEFKKELSEFLKKWDTNIELENIGTGWSDEYVMICYINGVYNSDGECLSEFTEVKLGSYISKD